MNVTHQVENILKASRSARNSDKSLWLIYAQKSGLNLSESQIETFKSMPSFETIRRTRQKIQEHGKYPADNDINEARYSKFVNVKANINYDDPEKLLEDQGYNILPFGQ